MVLNFVIRKKETQNFPNINRLKKKFGEDLLVSEFFLKWQDAIIFFELEQTVRFLTYFLNQILGTVAAKFKKR